MLSTLRSSLRFSASILASTSRSGPAPRVFAALAWSALSAAGDPDVPGTGACIRFTPGLTGPVPVSKDRDGLANPTVAPIPDEEWLALPPPRAKDGGASARVSTSGIATDNATMLAVLRMDLLQVRQLDCQPSQERSHLFRASANFQHHGHRLADTPTRASDHRSLTGARTANPASRASTSLADTADGAIEPAVLL